MPLDGDTCERLAARHRLFRPSARRVVAGARDVAERRYTIRDAWLFRGGNYPDKGVNATPALLDSIIAHTNSSLAPVPMDLEHGPTEAVLDFGRLMPGSLRRVTGQPPGGERGEWIVGRMEVDSEIDSRLRHRGLSVKLPSTHDAITKIAVTATPRVPGAQFNSEPGEGPTFAEGYLMPETPIATPPEAPAEEVRVAGIVGRLLAGIGLGPKPEAEVATTPLVTAPAFTAADIDAKLAAQEAEFTKRLATVKADADAATAKAREQEVKAFSIELAAKGVPQFAIDLGAPHAEIGEVTFSADTKPAEMTSQQAMRSLLERMAGTVPMGRILPSNDASGHEVEFNDRVSARAEELVKADPALSKSAAYERAALEVK